MKLLTLPTTFLFPLSFLGRLFHSGEKSELERLLMRAEDLKVLIDDHHERCIQATNDFIEKKTESNRGLSTPLSPEVKQKESESVLLEVHRETTKYKKEFEDTIASVHDLILFQNQTTGDKQVDAMLAASGKDLTFHQIVEARATVAKNRRRILKIAGRNTS